MKEIPDYRSERYLDKEIHARMGAEMIKRGIFCIPGTVFYISTVHSEEDIDETIEVFESALKASL